MGYFNFTDLIDLNELKDILTNIYKTTKMPLTLVDNNDEILFEIGVLQICTDFHIKNEEALKSCIKRKENQKNIIYKQSYKCDNNMLHIVIPIKPENIIIGNLIIGQFFYTEEEIDYKLYIEQAKKFNYDIDGYINSLSKIPVFSKEHVENIIELCVNIINQMIKTNLANSELKSKEKLLRTLINSMPDIVCFKDGNGQWIEANDFDLNLFGLNGIDYKGKKDSELAKYSEFYKDAFLTCEDSDELTWKSEKITRCEEIIPQPDGKQFTFDVIKIPLFENDKRKGLIVVGRDITEQKKAVSEMFESEKQFKQLFESMVEGVAFHEIIFDENNNPVNYKITNVNSSYEKILNIKKQDILNKTATEVYKLDTAPYLTEYYNVSQTGENFQFETYFSSMDKYFHISVISLKKGTFVTIFFDVTKQKKAEEENIRISKELSNAQKLLNTAFEQSSIPMILISSPDHIIRIANSAAGELLQVDVNKYIGKKIAEIEYIWTELTPDGEKIEKPWDVLPLFLALKGVESKNKEFMVKRKDGTIRWELVSGTPVYDDNKNLIAAIGIFPDITEMKKAEKELKESEELFRLMFEKSGDGNLLADNSKFIDCNQTAVEMLGYFDKNQLLNTHLSELSPKYQPDGLLSFEKANSIIKSAFDQGYKRFEWVHLKSDGNEIFMDITLTPIQLKGKPLLHTSWRDITKQKETEQKIIELNKSLESRIIALTQPLDDLSDLRFEDIFNVSEIQKIQDAFSDATGVASLITKPDGTPLTKPSNFCGLCNLIRKTEKGLSNCLHSDAVIGNNTGKKYIMQPCYSGGLWDGGTSIKVGDKHIANWLVGQVIDENIDKNKILKYADEIEADKTEFEKELSKVTRMSKDKFEKICIALNLIANQLSYLAIQNIQQARFIMDRKKAEENLRENEETFRLFMDNLKAAVFIKDSELKAKFTNKYFYELFGDYLIGRTPFELFPNNPEIASKMAQDDIDVMNGNVKMPIFEKVIDTNRNERYFETYKFKIPSKKGDMLGGIALEVTEVKKIEEKLKESRESFFKLIDIIPNGIVIHKQGKIEYINNSAIKIMEIDKAEEVIGKNVFSFVHPDYIELVKKRVIGQKDTELLIEEKFITAKNNIIDVEVSGKMFKYDGEILNIVAFRDITERKKSEEALRESEEKFRLLAENTSDIISLTTIKGEYLYVSPSVENILGYKQAEIIGIFSNEMILKEDIDYVNKWFENLLNTNSENKFTKFRMKHKNGTIYWFESLLNIIRDEKENPVYVLSSTRNITDKVISEEIIQNQIKELEAKNAEMERFTYTVSHDLKSPLITIKGFLGILNNDIKERKEDLIQKDMSRISNAADKMQNLLEDLLELSRIGRMINPSSKFSMNDVLKDVIELLNGVISNKNIKIIIQNNMPIVFGDRQRIYEVMQNLIENAIKFIGKTENPTIEIGCFENKFFVKDNGIGIDNKYLTKIFGLFDKLDKNSEGTGIGLALVKRIIELHHGNVWVESEGINKGATFYFTLP